MRKLAITAVLVASIAGAADGAGPDHSMPGTPGSANCRGQTIAAIAQAAKHGYLDDAYRGIGGVGRATGLSNQQIFAVVDLYCSGNLTLPPRR